jgi:hypothetical protein
MKSTTSGRVKIAPRASIPPRLANVSIAAATLGDNLPLGSTNKSRLCCPDVNSMTSDLNYFIHTYDGNNRYMAGLALKRQTVSFPVAAIPFLSEIYTV